MIFGNNHLCDNAKRSKIPEDSNEQINADTDVPSKTVALSLKPQDGTPMSRWDVIRYYCGVTPELMAESRMANLRAKLQVITSTVQHALQSIRLH